MRIAMVGGPYVPVPPALYGGTERVIYYLVKGLIEAGHEVVYLGSGDSKVGTQVIPIVDKAIYFPKESSALPDFKKQVRAAERETARQLRRIAPEVDIIHSHGFDLTGFKEYPGLTTLHGPIGFNELPYYLARSAQKYVSISKNQRAACPDLNYVSTVHNGLDPSEFEFVSEPEDYVCFLGRFDREKNPHLAIELALKLGIKIKLAGKYDYLGEGYFEQEIKKHFNNPLVEYLGELDFKQKVEVLSKAKCNLHPTGFREPFGLTILEAAYCGTPTLAIARGSMPELIQDGLTGALVEDFIEGYFAIEQCFKMDRKYIAKRAAVLFNYSNMAHKYVKAYKKVIKRTAPATEQLSIWPKQTLNNSLQI